LIKDRAIDPVNQNNVLEAVAIEVAKNDRRAVAVKVAGRGAYAMAPARMS
jgi:hypothetical protein